MKRRTVLRRGAAVLGGVSVAGGTIGVATAEETQDDDTEFAHYAVKQDAVDLLYDRAMLEAYKPALRINHLDVKPGALFGLRATDTSDTDPEPTDVLVYWASYSHQDGVSPFGGYLSDSHYGDHEPIYVFVDKTEDTIDRVLFSAYHWLKGVTTAPPTTEDGRPKMHVVNPWHQYRPAPAARSTDLADVRLEDLTGRYRSWLRNGMAKDIRPGATTNPWIMREHGSWWRPSSTFGLSVNGRQWMANALYDLGLIGADSSEVKQA